MSALLHPGVYVMEVPSGVRSIEGVPTSTTIFVGETERGPLAPTKIKGRAAYERLFGGYFRATSTSATSRNKVLLPYSLDAFFLNGGSTAYILRAMDNMSTAQTSSRTLDGTKIIEASSQGKWGDRISAVVVKSTDNDVKRWRLSVFYRHPGETADTLVEDWDKLSADAKDENYVVDVLKRSLYIRWADGVDPATMPTLADITKLEVGSIPGGAVTEQQIVAGLGGAATKLSGGASGDSPNALGSGAYTTRLADLEEVDDAALLVCGAEKLFDYSATTAARDIEKAFIDYVEAQRPRQDLFYVGQLPRHRNSTPTAATTSVITDFNVLTASNFAGLYWPWLDMSDPVGAGRNPAISTPPGGAIAGLFARTDGRRGVWKAPAGVEASIAGARRIEYKLLDSHSDELNPKGINALRTIPGAGSVVWGARTMQPNSEWRYVSVRRTAIFLRLSIYNGIQWAVFEPNDAPLWDALRTSIGAFMETQFRNGAFAGRTSKEAYFVKVDDETTTEIDQAAGIVNVLVGFAPLRPAEFVVVKLSQKTKQN